MAVTGKTGADAIFRAIRHVCQVIQRYRVKFNAVIDAAVAANAITSAQATTIKDFLATLDALCTALELLAGYSGF